jgi:hypothetical protein
VTTSKSLAALDQILLDMRVVCVIEASSSDERRHPAPASMRLPVNPSAARSCYRARVQAALYDE